VQKAMETEVIKKSKQIGKRLMIIGLIVILFCSLLFVLTIFSADRSRNYGKGILYSIGLSIAGIVLLLMGIQRYFLKNKALLLNLNKELLGAEEPEKSWKCPKCNFQNPNATYSCLNCSYKLN
jgi:glucan phosphoethanolaminetransferase (alkaline phosphatase superfamily)